MKSNLLAYTAIIAVASAYAPGVLAADDQTPTEPAGTQYDPAPTIEEELVYLRDIIALQTLRLDEAEQMLARQNSLLEAQERKILNLERVVVAGQSASGAFVAAAGGYVVKSGDTLGAIATQFGTSIGALAAANDLRSPYPLSVGQRLAVPGAAAPDFSAPEPAAPTPQVLAEKIEQPTGEATAPEPQKVAAATPETRPDVTKRAVDAQRKKDEEQPDGALPEEVGIRPEEEEERPYLSIFSDVGGILTPGGSLYVEPSIDYTVTSDNRFFFQGFEIVDAVLIGAIEATDSDRRAYSEGLGLRFGLTDRLEVDGKVSYVTRDDRITGIAIDDLTSTLRDLHGSGIGDAEMGLHYQINSGRKFPYTIFNMRAKAPTGLGPFEVARAPNGVETELATGSGYWSIEPSLTFILPTDPAVIFANFGYQLNMKSFPDAIITRAADDSPTQIISEFNPGDAIRTNIGVGLSLNDRLSVNFGYDQSHILATTTVREVLDMGSFVTTMTSSPSTTIGAFLFGGSYSLSDRVRLNFNTAFGATDEAPDVRVALRAQIRLFD